MTENDGGDCLMTVYSVIYSTKNVSSVIKMVISVFNCKTRMFIASFCYKNRRSQMKYYHSTLIFPIDYFDHHNCNQNES